jgi:biopolymer transport protein ExbD
MPKLEPIPNKPSRAGARRARAARVSTSLAEINVVPLVDVMLVLLVIFMVAAPMMTQGLAVNLPQSAKSKPLNPEPVVVTVPRTFRQDGRIRIGKDAVRLEVLAERARQETLGQANPTVRLAADGEVTIQELYRVFDELMRGGVRNVQIQSQPPTGRTP